MAPREVTSNSLFNYLYRDASNYKQYGLVYCRGVPTPAELEQLKATLHEGDAFVAEAVGIPSRRFDVDGDYPANEDDHGWHEFCSVTPYENTVDDDAPTIQALIKRFVQANKKGWKPPRVKLDPQLKAYRKYLEGFNMRGPFDRPLPFNRWRDLLVTKETGRRVRAKRTT